ncbi:hypothetical protein ONE63_011537 [Megalurothrips usitatus]|uniref:Uncharacterized protein n=1 Tax=Megalurothrips usitatus TaxID=439358 RepID=A0AAV7X243_9NEOP|nr:hypothetical protein ONE63_011537 [Megalurothrips usitatus]
MDSMQQLREDLELSSSLSELSISGDVSGALYEEEDQDQAAPPLRLQMHEQVPWPTRRRRARFVPEPPSWAARSLAAWSWRAVHSACRARVRICLAIRRNHTPCVSCSITPTSRPASNVASDHPRITIPAVLEPPAAG